MKQTLTIRVGKDQLTQLRDIAKAEDRSLSAIVRRFVENGIKKEKADTGKAERTDEL